jgi:hypothetical protein
VPCNDPTDPGWAPFVHDAVQQAKKQSGDPGGSPYVRLEVTGGTGPPVAKFLEGGPPGKWEKDANVTQTFTAPRHLDYTRFRRTYPRVVIGYYFRVTVKVTVYWDPQTPLWTKTWTLWKEQPPRSTRKDHVVYRWVLTSWEETLTNPDGGKATAWHTDETPPDDTYPEPAPDDLVWPTQPFPPHLVPTDPAHPWKEVVDQPMEVLPPTPEPQPNKPKEKPKIKLKLPKPYGLKSMGISFEAGEPVLELEAELEEVADSRLLIPDGPARRTDPWVPAYAVEAAAAQADERQAGPQ